MLTTRRHPLPPDGFRGTQRSTGAAERVEKGLDPPNEIGAASIRTKAGERLDAFPVGYPPCGKLGRFGGGETFIGKSGHDLTH